MKGKNNYIYTFSAGEQIFTISSPYISYLVRWPNKTDRQEFIMINDKLKQQINFDYIFSGDSEIDNAEVAKLHSVIEFLENANQDDFVTITYQMENGTGNIYTLVLNSKILSMHEHETTQEDLELMHVVSINFG